MASIGSIANGELGSAVRSKLNLAIVEANKVDAKLDSSVYTAADVKTKYESNSDTNALTDALLGKLNGVESGATADQSASEIKTAYESNADTNAYTDSDKTKLGTALVEGGEITRYSETTAAATAAVDRADGGKQTLNLTANVTLTVAMANGEDMELTILNGDTYSVTWPAGDWLGGSLPTLAAKTRVIIDKDSTGTLNFSLVGDYS